MGTTFLFLFPFLGGIIELMSLNSWLQIHSRDYLSNCLLGHLCFYPCLKVQLYFYPPFSTMWFYPCDFKAKLSFPLVLTPAVWVRFLGIKKIKEIGPSRWKDESALPSELSFLLKPSPNTRIESMVLWTLTLQQAVAAVRESLGSIFLTIFRHYYN
jgi:hypothetical protein